MSRQQPESDTHSPSSGPCCPGDPPAWSYTGTTGPAAWGSLCADWSVADTGCCQSPVAISASDCVAASLPPVRLDGGRVQARPVDTGNIVRWDMAPGCRLTIDEQAYALLQFHFHAPSEHTIDGGRHALELHFVHADTAGHLAVLAVMVNATDQACPAYRPLVDSLDRLGTRDASAEVAGATFEINPYDLLPGDRAYFAYAGSLTTPPCAEGVRWLVLREPVTVSPAQLRAFTDRYAANCRPLQPLNQRQVQVSR